MAPKRCSRRCLTHPTAVERASTTTASANEPIAAPTARSIGPRGRLAHINNSSSHAGEQASQRFYQSSSLHISLRLGPAREVVSTISQLRISSIQSTLGLGHGLLSYRCRGLRRLYSVGRLAHVGIRLRRRIR